MALFLRTLHFTYTRLLFTFPTFNSTSVISAISNNTFTELDLCTTFYATACAFVFVLQTVTLALTFTVFSGLHAQPQCLPCPPLFQGQTGWAKRFFAGFGNCHNMVSNPGSCFVIDVLCKPIGNASCSF